MSFHGIQSHRYVSNTFKWQEQIEKPCHHINSQVHNGRQRMMDIQSANFSLIGHHILWYIFTRMDSHLTTWQTSLNNHQSELFYIFFLSFLRWLITSKRGKTHCMEKLKIKTKVLYWYKLNYQYYNQIYLTF